MKKGNEKGEGKKSNKRKNRRLLDRNWRVTAGGTTVVDRYGYTYDSLGNRLSKDVPTTVNALNDQDCKQGIRGHSRMALTSS